MRMSTRDTPIWLRQWRGEQQHRRDLDRMVRRLYLGLFIAWGVVVLLLYYR